MKNYFEWSNVNTKQTRDMDRVTQMLPRRLLGKQKPSGGQLDGVCKRHQWTCPFCQTTISCQTQRGLSCSKKWHVKSRHSNVKLELVLRRKIGQEEIVRPPGHIPGGGTRVDMCHSKLWQRFVSTVANGSHTGCQAALPGRESEGNAKITLKTKLENPSLGPLSSLRPRRLPEEKKPTKGMIFSSCRLKTYDRTKTLRHPYCRTCLFALFGTTFGRSCKDNVI